MRLFWLLPLLCLLSACGGGQYARYSPGHRIYPQPGPPDDPWRPYVREASDRFSVPQQWIRAVMHQESGGQEYRDGQPIVSSAGAMGLMQLMPATYADLQAQYGLGSDPFEPRDNIMAGTGYIRQMYQKYGAPAFLAAYNAGPQRLDDYLATGRALPNETVNYVASIAPNLGNQIAMTGPLAVYATGGGTAYAQADSSYDAPVQLASYRVRSRRSAATTACWHDPDAAYDPDAPCQAPPVETASAAPIPAPPYAASQSAVYQPVSYQPAAAPGCIRNPDAAYDAPCEPSAPQPAPAPAPAYSAPMGQRYAAAQPYAAQPYAVQPYAAQPYLATPYRAAPPPSRPAVMMARAALPSYGAWAIQVGAFNSVDQARFATTMARQADYARLAGSQSVVQQTTPFGQRVLYRARLAGLARDDAGSACSTLRAQNIPCMVVTPGG